MSKKAAELVEQMRQTQAQWKRRDLVTVLNGFGFNIKKGSGRSPHDKVWHPEFPQLIMSLPRHRKLGVAYVNQVVVIVDALKILRQRKK